MTGSNENSKLIGIMSGVLLYVCWFFLVFFLESFNNVQHTQMNFHTPLISWIYFGPIPLFITAGLYYFTKSSLLESKQQQVTALKGMIAGFFIWTAVIVILHIWVIDAENYGIFTTIGGYLLMIVLIWAFKGRIRTANS